VSEENKANMRKIAQKAGEEKIAESTPDVCESPSPGEPVPIPYPNSGTSNDIPTSSQRVDIEGQEVMTKAPAFKKSTGDEPGQSGRKGMRSVVNAAKTYEILKIPVWIWSLAAIILAVIIWLSTLNNIQPTEPMEPYAIDVFDLLL
jgi:hypothetical protein